MKKVPPDAVRLAADCIDGFPQRVLAASQFGAPGTDAWRIDQADAVNSGSSGLDHDVYPFQRYIIVARRPFASAIVWAHPV